MDLALVQKKTAIGINISLKTTASRKAKFPQTVNVKFTAFTAPLSRGKNSNVNTVDWPADITELIAEDVRIKFEESQLYWLLYVW